MEYFPWISMVVSIVVLLVQALVRYGLAKQDEMVRKRFEEVEKDVAALTLGVKTIENQFTSVLVTLEAIKTKQESEYNVREKQESLTAAMHHNMVSKELFDARMATMDTRLSTLDQTMVNISKAQTEILGEFVKWLHRKETA